MIIEEYDESLFISRFEDYKRVGVGGNFSYKGLRCLFEYLDESYTEENPLKLDVISLCCDFLEYKSVEEYLKDYLSDVERDNFEDEEEYLNKVEEWINEKKNSNDKEFGQKLWRILSLELWLREWF